MMLGDYPVRVNDRVLPRPFLLVFGVLAIVACLLPLRFFGPRLIEAYWQGPGGLATRQQLGFELLRVRSSISGRPEVYAFTKIVPGSPFAKAGVEQGDTFERWLGYPTRLDSMYEWFSEARGREIQLHLTNISYGDQWPAHRRTVTVVVPR